MAPERWTEATTRVVAIIGVAAVLGLMIWAVVWAHTGSEDVEDRRQDERPAPVPRSALGSDALSAQLGQTTVTAPDGPGAKGAGAPSDDPKEWQTMDHAAQAPEFLEPVERFFEIHATTSVVLLAVVAVALIAAGIATELRARRSAAATRSATPTTLAEAKRAVSMYGLVRILLNGGDPAGVDYLLATGAHAVIVVDGTRLKVVSSSKAGGSMDHPAIRRVIEAAGERIVVEDTGGWHVNLSGSVLEWLPGYRGKPSRVNIDELARGVAIAVRPWWRRLPGSRRGAGS